MNNQLCWLEGLSHLMRSQVSLFSTGRGGSFSRLIRHPAPLSLGCSILRPDALRYGRIACSSLPRSAAALRGLSASTRRSVCDSHYHFFCSFVSRKFRFFPKKSAKFRENLRKILIFFWKIRSWEERGICSSRNPEKFWFNLAKIQQHSGKICEILEKNSKQFSNF